jgi:cytoskeletal protein RodZ
MNGSIGGMTMADGLGEYLRRERQLRHISLDEVADRTKISRRYLEAIEEERYDHLPGEAFVRGFIRSYAQSVGLDPEEAILIYNHSRTADDVVQPQAELLSAARHAWNQRVLLWLLVTGVIIVGGVLISAVSFLNSPNLGHSILSPGIDTASRVSTAAPLVLTVKATSDTWLRVTIDDQESQDLVLRAGQSTKWIGRDGFILSIGNARTTHLRLNGRDLTTPPLPQSHLRQYSISREMLP